ncbi:DUF5615 family PIN-like protein [Natronorubrum sp. FCH18a]|uniref:DUF5615 family PIN-like protein n=1 Tax=Natronorubrum sp. FCH18a TaxID=3447018 RepID=UPI003F51223B
MGVTAAWHSPRHTCSTARAGCFARENRSCRRPKISYLRYGKPRPSGRGGCHTVRDKGKLGEPDRDHLSYDVENDWILLTFDDDFLSLVERAGLDHAGIIFVQQAGRDIGDVVKTVDSHLETRSPNDREIHYC